MYSITDLRKDTLIDIEGVPYRVTEYSHKQLGRGGATVRVKVKNLLTGQMLDKTYRNNEKIDPANLDRIKLQYLYSDNDSCFFMDLESFENYEVSLDLSSRIKKYYPEGAEVLGMYYKESIIGFELDHNTEIKIKSTPDGDKGNTSSGATKAAIIESGTEVQVPMFINIGDTIKIDTRTGDYMQRIKN